MTPRFPRRDHSSGLNHRFGHNACPTGVRITVAPCWAAMRSIAMLVEMFVTTGPGFSAQLDLRRDCKGCSSDSIFANLGNNAETFTVRVVCKPISAWPAPTTALSCAIVSVPGSGGMREWRRWIVVDCQHIAAKRGEPPRESSEHELLQQSTATVRRPWRIAPTSKAFARISR